jgi:translation elongation factor EF-Tu-like GTPase
MSFYEGRAPDIEAEVTYLPTSSGGRTNPVYSGYRPNHLIRDDYLTSGYHEYLDKEEVAPGERARAHIWFITPEVYPHTMWIGKEIRVQEASRLVGYAKVIRVFNKTLERSD